MYLFNIEQTGSGERLLTNMQFQCLKTAILEPAGFQLTPHLWFWGICGSISTKSANTKLEPVKSEREREREMFIIHSDGVRTHVAVKTMWTDYSSLVHKNIEE